MEQGGVRKGGKGRRGGARGAATRGHRRAQSWMFVWFGASIAPRIIRASTYPLQEFFLFVTLQHPYQVA